MNFHQRLFNLERRIPTSAQNRAAMIHGAMQSILSDVETYDTAATFAVHVENHGHDEASLPLADALAARLAMAR